MSTGVRVTDEAIVLQAASLLLTYPGAQLQGQLPQIREVVQQIHLGEPRTRLLNLIDHLAATPQGDLERHYVEVFDLRRACCMYLTWWTDGETRRRGMSLARLKGVYREHGMELRKGELPDFLPVMCEFAATASLERGLSLLQEFRAGLEMLRLALIEFDTPYRWPVEAVCALLPGPSPEDEAAARQLAHSGPPIETVGLDGFATATIPGGRR